MEEKHKAYFGSEPSKADIRREIEDNKYEKEQSRKKAGAKKNELAKKMKTAKKMPEGHNRISHDGTITNRLYPGGYNGKK